MRIFKKILLILGIIIFVLSLGFNVVLSMSSTNNLIFKDSLESRFKLYSTSTYKLKQSNEFYIVSENKYGATQKAIDKVSCYKEDGSVSATYICSQISSLYEADGTLVRTSYFPGDGYKYTVEGDVKTKSAYSNASLEAYFKSLVNGAYSSLSYIIFEYNNEAAKEYMSYSTDFKFNDFSIQKIVNVQYKNEEINYEFKESCTFDNNDYLVKLNINESANLNISYEKQTLNFPSFEGFVG